MRSVPLIIGPSELKFGTVIVGGFIVDVSSDGKAIRDDSVSLNLTSTFGSSRQLMTGPDAATCIIVAASLGLLAGGDLERYLTLVVMLTLMTGVMFILAGWSRLGFIANFLSQPTRASCLPLPV